MDQAVLAVDGGNSKTIAIVADVGGGILAAAQAGGSNYQSIGRRAASELLAGLIGEVMGQAGIARVAASCYGLAGADRDKDFAVFREILAPLDPAEKTVLVNDTILALRAATPDGVGVALIGGAGSNCIGMDQAGRVRKASGLGPLAGDRAYAGALVLDAVAAALKGVDGRGPRTALEAKFKAALQIEELEDIIEFEFFDNRRDFHLARLAPLVFAAADEGDAVALAILRDHGAAVAQAVLAVLRGLFRPADAVPLALGGSVLQKGSNPALVDTIRELVAREFPRVNLIKLQAPPVLGAILRALDEIGKTPDAEGLGKLKRELQMKLREMNVESVVE
jgi:N-acetylglucosamine kinase-like BadF-type ATPase